MQRKILVVDDARTNRLILYRILSSAYEVLEAEDGEEALSILRREHERISAVLLDIVMPKLDGYGVLSRMRAEPQLAQIPVIVTTGNTDTGTEVRALSLGANDFVTKPYNPEVIRHRLWNTINLRETAAMANLAKRDELTGLYNRGAFFRLAEEMILAAEPGHYVMGCFDVNNFKVINDQYGSVKGDEILRQLARVFDDFFTPRGGICCRIMADNFAVLYPRELMDKPEMAELRRRAAVLDGSIAPITFSIGRYIVDDLSIPVSGMYDRAGIAESSVKRRFDTNVALYNEAMRDRILAEQEIINEMDSALEKGEFEVWFQPQFNHSTGALVGTEALVRWRRPGRGIVAPGLFIPVFERNGFVYELDKFVWEEVCRRLRVWLDEGRSPLPVSVNISRYDIFRDDLTDVITGLVEKYNIPVDMLRLEITESAFARSTEQIVSVVKKLITLGFTVEIDDFGSGYSSLNTLKDVPAQVLKLDMRFLENNENSDRGGNILESIVRMAKWLGMSVIAEGVETVVQAEYLKTIGCNYVQGYLYARPMPLVEYERLAESVGREERMRTLETVENLNNSAFWDPRSIDTLVFNGFVGGACIFEWHNEHIEIIRANEKYAKSIGAGCTLEDVLSLNWHEHMDETAARDTRWAVESALENGEATYEACYFDLPGAPGKTWLRTTFRLIVRTSDRCLLFSTNENITAQREAERKERETAERMQAVLDNVSVGMLATVLRGEEVEYLFVNDRYYELHGYTREQYEREVASAYDLFHPDDRRRVYDAVQSINEPGRSAAMEYRVIRRDGREAWIRLSVSTRRFEGVDDPVQFSALMDISTEKEAELGRRKSSEQLQFINDSSHELLTGTDADAGINGTLRQVLDYFDGSRAYVMEIDGVRALINNTYEVCAEGATPEIDNLQDIPLEIIAPWLKSFRRDGHINIEDVDALDDSRADEREILRAQGIRSLVAVPLMSGEEVTGFVGVDDPCRRQSHVPQLRAIGDFLAAALARRDMTARIESDREALLRLMNDTPGGFARIWARADGVLEPVFANDGLCELVGMTQEEIFAAYQGDALWGVHPDDLDVVEAAIGEMLATGEARSAKYRLRHGNGGYIWLMIFGRVSRDESGETYLNIYYTDLSAQERSELSVREIMPFILSTIMSSSSDLSFAKDRNLVYLCCSGTFARMVGLEKESDVVGKTDYDLFPKELAERYRADDRRVMESGESIVDMLEPILSDDGLPRYSSTSKYILRDTAGSVIGICGVGRDITESREAYSRLKLLTDSIPGGLASYASTPEGIRITYFNDGFCRILGYTREEYAKLSADQTMVAAVEEDRPGVRERLHAMINEDAPLDHSFRVRCLDGAVKWVNISGAVTERHGDDCYFSIVLYDVTKPKLAEEAARIHTEELKAAISHMGKLVFEYDPVSRTLTSPVEFAAHYKMSAELPDVPDSLINAGVIDEATLDVYRGFYDAILRGESSGSAEYLDKTADGAYHWRHAVFSSVFDSEGRPVKTIIAVDDTTELHDRYELERGRPSLGSENLLFRALFDLSGREILEYFDAGGRPLPPEEWLGVVDKNHDLPDIFVDEEERERFRLLHDLETLLAAFERGESEFSIDYRRRMPSGEVIWVRNLLHMLRRPGGGNVLLFEYCYDVGEEKLLEQMYAAVVNANYDYVARVNGRDKSYSVITKAGDQDFMPPLRGDDLDAAALELCHKLVHPDDLKLALNELNVAAVKRRLENAERWQFTCREQGPGGEIRHKRFTAFYLDRKLDVLVLIREDITQIMREENGKKALLADALAAANQANQTKSAFLNRMSHELRTPMNAIIGLAALSATDIDDRALIEENISRIGMSARYLLSLINDILEMSRIESGHLTLNESPFSFAGFLTEINAVAAAQAEEKGLSYEPAPLKGIAPAYVGDEEKLRTILLNVLSNAVKFTPPGGAVSLSVEQRRCANNKATVRFTVEDSGVGMDEDFLKNLFEPFTQELPDVSADSTGAGLGLAITKNLVELMNGTIEAKSVRNEGSVFTIDVLLGTAEPAAEREAPERKSAKDLSGRRILVAEDQPINADIARRLLERAGAQVVVAVNGLEAVEAFAASPEGYFDAVLMDIRMPVMDGLTATRSIRSLQKKDCLRVPIVAMTANAFDEDVELSLASGMDAHLIKPIEPQLLFSTLLRLMGER